MKAIEHTIRHQYQPTSTSCSPTALSMMLEHYNNIVDPQTIETNVPQCVNEKGEKVGTINQQLATWCLSVGYAVDLYTFDFQIIDQSWNALEKDQLLERLQLRKSGWVVPGIGQEWTKQYTQSYIDFVAAGGNLLIQPAATTKLLYELVAKGPFLPSVSYSTLYGAARSRIVNEKESVDDDINGKAMNHSIVVYGNTEAGDFLIADPWKKPGLHTVEPERLLAAITAAQIECDSLLFLIQPK